MPTGFTSVIDGNPACTIQDYLRRCARGLSPLIRLRGKSLSVPLPKKLKPDRFYQERVTEAKKQLTALKAMSKADIATACAAEYKKEVSWAKRYNAKEAKLRLRYKAMQQQVMAWNPPAALASLNVYGASSQAVASTPA